MVFLQIYLGSPWKLHFVITRIICVITNDDVRIIVAVLGGWQRRNTEVRNQMKWGIISMVSEPDPLIYAFVAHHLAEGASDIHLYFDVPNRKLEREITRHSAVRVTNCTARFWTSLGVERSWAPFERQKVICNHAYRQSTCDWMLHIDADEFVVMDEALSARLQISADNPDFLQIPVAERVFIRGEPQRGIFDGVFRIPCAPGEDATLKAVYGDDLKFLDQGVTGYPSMKSFFRTGRNIRLGIHTGLPMEGVTYRTAAPGPRNLYHFDGLTAKSWSLKILRKMNQAPGWVDIPEGPRKEQFKAVHEVRHDQAAMSDVFWRINTVSETQAEQLEARALITTHDFRFEERIGAHFPKLNVDLSPEHFDNYGLNFKRRNAGRRLSKQTRRFNSLIFSGAKFLFGNLISRHTRRN